MLTQMLPDHDAWREPIGTDTVRWGERGQCPRCGSGSVTQVIVGLPTRMLVESAPEWVRFAGCVAFGPEDRQCESCGHEWVGARSGGT